MTTNSYLFEVTIAGIGGVIVLIGLLMELEKEEYKTVSQFRCFKSRKLWGERLVIAGIVVEVVVAIYAAKNEFQIKRQVEKTASLIEKRSISDPQIEKFKKSLRSFDRQPVCVFYLNDDSETYDYAKRIREMLDKAGYNVSGVSPALSKDLGFKFSNKIISTNGTSPSVFLGIFDTNHVEAYIPAVQNAFKEIGIDAPYVTFKQPALTGDLIILVRERF